MDKSTLDKAGRTPTLFVRFIRDRLPRNHFSAPGRSVDGAETIVIYSRAVGKTMNTNLLLQSLLLLALTRCGAERLV